MLFKCLSLTILQEEAHLLNRGPHTPRNTWCIVRVTACPERQTEVSPGRVGEEGPHAAASITPHPPRGRNGGGGGGPPPPAGFLALPTTTGPEVLSTRVKGSQLIEEKGKNPILAYFGIQQKQ